MAAKIPARFTNADAARAHLEKLLWPEGPICPHCGVIAEATKLKGKSTRPGVYWCNACQAPFSVTVGTVYERSKVPLNIWLYATHLLCASKKGISSHQLARMLGVTYKTAWFLSHRIRAAMDPLPASEPPLGGAGQIVEADEAELGVSKHTRPRKGGRKANLKSCRLLSVVDASARARSLARRVRSASTFTPRSNRKWTARAHCTRTAPSITRSAPSMGSMKASITTRHLRATVGTESACM